MNNAELQNIFSYHRPTSDQVPKYEEIRDTARNFATRLNDLCPDSREKSLAFTSLQQVVMWANAAIAIHGKESE